MDHDLCGAQKKVWKMLKNMKKPINELCKPKELSKMYGKNTAGNHKEAISIENYETNIK